MRRRVARFLAMSRPDRWLLAQAIVVLPMMRMALRLMGFKRTHLTLRRLRPIRGKEEGATRRSMEEAARAAQLVYAAARHGLLDRNCLTQSLTLWWLLRRRGIESEICIGVRKVGDGLEAHAWVEHSGNVLGDHQDVGRHFTPLASTTDMARLDGLSGL